MQVILKFLMSRGMNRGLLEGSRTWIILGGVALALRLLYRISHPEPKVLFSHKMKPGESLVFTHDQLADARIYAQGVPKDGNMGRARR